MGARSKSVAAAPTSQQTPMTATIRLESHKSSKKMQSKMGGQRVVKSETAVVKGLISQNRRNLFFKATGCILLTAAAVALFASGVGALSAPTILIYPAPSKAIAYACIVVGGIVAPVSTYKAVQFIRALFNTRAWTPEGIMAAGRAAHRSPVTAENFQQVVGSLQRHNNVRPQQVNDDALPRDTGGQ